MGFEDKVADIYAAADEVRKVLDLWGNLKKGTVIDRISTLSGEKPELTVDFLSKTLDKDFVSMIDLNISMKQHLRKFTWLIKSRSTCQELGLPPTSPPKEKSSQVLLTFHSTMPYGTSYTWRSQGRLILKNVLIAIPGTQARAGFAHHHPSTGDHPVKMHLTRGKIESGGKSEGMFSLWQVGLNSNDAVK